MNDEEYDYFPTEPEDKPLGSGNHSLTSSASPSRLSAIRGILARNQDILRNAGSLIGTTGVTSVLGFGYWIFAARYFPQEAVGYGTAAISIMMLLSTVGIFGFGTMLIGELPHQKSPGGLMMAGILASLILSIVLGLGFALVSLAFGKRFVEIDGTVGRMVVFSVGVAITSATFVFDDATIGLMRGGLQLARNTAFSVIKIIALPACALVLHDVFGVGIMLAWVVGTFASVFPVIIMIKRGGASILHKPDWRTLWRLRSVTLAHNWLNMSITTPARLIPVLVVLVVSPSDNAAFYIATMLVSFLTMIPTSLSTVLFAIASAAPELMSEKLRFVLRMSLIIGVSGGLVLGLSSHLVLSIFGASYARVAAGPLWLLIAGYIPGLPNTVYIAVCRATGRLKQAALFLTTTAGVQMVAVLIGGKLGGLYGLSYGMLAVAILEALVTAPTVLRAAYGSTAADSAAAPTAQARHEAPLQSADDAMRLRQEAGLTALISLATTVNPDRRRHPIRATGRQPASEATARMPHTRPQASMHRDIDPHGQATVRATVVNPALTDTSWWPDINEATFHNRQEAGMAALIAIATHAARY